MMGVRSSPHYPRIISPAKIKGQRNADPSFPLRCNHLNDTLKKYQEGETSQEGQAK
jgi:hypothetical protein